MIGPLRDVKIFALMQLPRLVAADDIRDSLNYHPVFCPPRVSLQTKARAGFNFEHFNLKPRSFFQHRITAPWSLISFRQFLNLHQTRFRGCQDNTLRRFSPQKDRNGALSSNSPFPYRMASKASGCVRPSLVVGVAPLNELSLLSCFFLTAGFLFRGLLFLCCHSLLLFSLLVEPQDAVF